jgi:hypothetical protein
LYYGFSTEKSDNCTKKQRISPHAGQFRELPTWRSFSVSQSVRRVSTIRLLGKIITRFGVRAGAAAAADAFEFAYSTFSFEQRFITQRAE